MKHYIATAFAASALLAAPAWAQDMPAEEPEAPAEETAGESTIAPMLEDQGEQIALQAQTENVAIEPEPAVSAYDAVIEDLKANGLHVGYNEKQDAIIGVEVAAIACKNPAEDLAFITKRDLLAMEAYLKARASVGRSIASTFSGAVRSEYMDPPDQNPLVKAMEAKKAEVEAKKAELAKKLAELDTAEANALRGVTIGDRLDFFLDAMIKKLDNSYDPAVVSQDKLDRVNALKADVETLKAEYAALDEAAEKALPKEQAKNMTDTQVLGSMRFFGCVVQAQSENWNPEEKAYEVAVAVVWSRKLHKLALASLNGDGSVRGKPDPKNRTFEDWLSQQDFSSMVGSRQFTDKEGRKFFIGVGAAQVPDKVVSRRGARAQAQESARAMAAFAMLGEGDSQRHAHRAMSQMSDDSSYATANLADTIQANIDPQNIQGMEEREVFTLVNKLSGMKIYVAVMAINPALAAQSKDMLDTTAAGAVQNERENQRRIGQQMGRDAAVEAAKRNKDAIRQGALEGAKGVADKLPQKPSMQRNGGQGAAPKAPAPAQKAAPQGGVFTGDAEMEMDF